MQMFGHFYVPEEPCLLFTVGVVCTKTVFLATLMGGSRRGILGVRTPSPLGESPDIEGINASHMRLDVSRTSSQLPPPFRNSVSAPTLLYQPSLLYS